MVSATDSAKSHPAQRVWIILAIVSLLGEPGCARLRSSRQRDRPFLGTLSASDPRTGPGRAGSEDLYADRVGQTEQPSGVVLARPSATQHGEAENDSSTPVRDDRPRVSLQPPVSVKAVNVASRSQTGKPDRSGGSGLEPVSLPVVPRFEEERPVAGFPQPSGTQTGVRLAESRRRLDRLKTYQVKMSHQERVAGTLNPAEDVVLSVRRDPKAVRLEWHSGPNKGREVVYAADASGGLMHVHLANSVIPRLSMAPDSPLATRNSRHPITEAGFDTILANMEIAFRRQQSGDNTLGKLSYLGLEKPESLDQPCHKLVRVTPTKETWVVYLDPATDLPVLVQATDGSGDLLERYVFRDPVFDPDELATADAFDPDSRWGPSKGLFQRLAHGGSATPKDSESR